MDWIMFTRFIVGGVAAIVMLGVVVCWVGEKWDQWSHDREVNRNTYGRKK